MLAIFDALFYFRHPLFSPLPECNWSLHRKTANGDLMDPCNTCCSVPAPSVIGRHGDMLKRDQISGPQSHCRLYPRCHSLTRSDTSTASSHQEPECHCH